MRGKLSIIVGFTAALGAMSAHAQTDAQKSAAAVLAATDQFAREYGSGRAPATQMQAATANPAVEGTNDLSALVNQFDDNATYAGTLQPFWLRGKAQIQDLWSRYFARYPDLRLIFRDRAAQVFGDASVESGFAEMYMGASPTT